MFEDLTRKILEFRDERDWQQYHSVRNLAASISIEAAELLELFQWSDDSTLADDLERNREDVRRELADIIIYCMLLAHEAGFDLASAVTDKLDENERKYPAEKARGSSAKYDRL